MTQSLAQTGGGRVCLIGAGPGDPGLISVKGRELLQHADVVVFDALASTQLLDLAPACAQRIAVGKRAGLRRASQQQINEILAAKAAEGKLVVRLKGGDPFVFGRGAEEAVYLASRGIRCEVIPGITAAVGAAAAAGITLTHRACASTVTFVTGHEDPAKPTSAIDYQALSNLVTAGGTVCVYMGAARLAAIAGCLLQNGAAGEIPAAVIQWGTLPQQSSVLGQLVDIADLAATAGLGSPAILVVGQVVGMRDLELSTKQPLSGLRVLITRPQHQAARLRDKLSAAGAVVLDAPTIQVLLPDDWTAIDEALRGASDFDWLILTSVNGVRILTNRLRHLGMDARSMGGVKFGVIGSATARALRRYLRIDADLVPPRFVAESLAESLIESDSMRNRKVLLLRAAGARPVLAQMLRTAGADVREVALYHIAPVDSLPETAVAALQRQEIDWVTYTSSSTVHALSQFLDDPRVLHQVRVASIGPITSRTVRELGFEVAAEANPSDIDGLVAAIVASVSGVGDRVPAPAPTCSAHQDCP